MLNFLIAGNDGITAIFDNIFPVKLSISDLLTNLPNPSVVFKNTFPVNPSVIIASIFPENASLPSTFPTKFIPNSSDFSFNKL